MSCKRGEFMLLFNLNLKLKAFKGFHFFLKDTRKMLSDKESTGPVK